MSWKRLSIRLDSYYSDYLSTYSNRLLLAGYMSPGLGSSLVHLPTKRHTYTIIKGPHIDKESREVWELVIYRKLLTVDGPLDSVRRFKEYLIGEERSHYSSVRVSMAFKESTFIPYDRPLEKKEYKLKDYLFSPFAPAMRAIPRPSEHPDLQYLDPTKIVRQELEPEDYALTKEDEAEALKIGQPTQLPPKNPPSPLTEAEWKEYERLLQRQPGEPKHIWLKKQFLGPPIVFADRETLDESNRKDIEFEKSLEILRDKYLGDEDTPEKTAILDEMNVPMESRKFKTSRGPERLPSISLSGDGSRGGGRVGSGVEGEGEGEDEEEDFEPFGEPEDDFEEEQ